MKKVKALLFVLTLPLITCVLVAVLESCQQDENFAVKSKPSNAPSDCFNSFVKGISDVSKQKISYFTHSGNIRRSSSVNTNDRIDIAVNFPPNTQQSYIDRLSEIETIEDMARLSHECAADYELAGEGTEGYVVAISQEALYGSLEEMIAQSKEYLKSKGMTDDDIQEMLDENDADESSLVVFAWGLSIVECEETNAESENSGLTSFIPCTRVKASGLSPTARQVIGCAVSAIGLDIINYFQQSATKKWTAAIIKRMFKAYLPKVMGPAGTALIIVEFTRCMVYTSLI
ncbi:MAG: hypothetical protein IJ190_02520 [Prevotella sp.]|nr:hypothetical protein [Prevotella sp.]